MFCTLFSECPSCYQQIDDETDDAEIRFASAYNRLTTLQNMLSDSNLMPFDPRVMEKQQLIDSVVMIVNALNMREANLTSRYNNLATVVMQALQLQSSQIQTSLDMLKSRATTVIVLASTSNELVDRIISEFFAANSFLDIIRNDLLPGIQASAQRIDSSLTGALSDSVTLNQIFSSVSEQISNIQNDLMLLITMLTNTRQDTSAISIFSTNTSALINNLHETRDMEITRVDSITHSRNELASDIQMLLERISQLPPLTDPPSESDIRALISLSGMVKVDVDTDIASEIFSQERRLNITSQLLQAERERLEVLQNRLMQIQGSVDSQTMRSQLLVDEVNAVVGSVNQQVDLAEMILQNLEQFSNNSLRISIQANVALQSVTSTNEQVTLAQTQAQNLLQRIAQASSQVNATKQLLLDTWAIISQVQQVSF